MAELVDLRSDTVTRPTAAMRRAMAEAEVGDDFYGEDPTVRRLEEVAAERFGHEAGLFTPSGVMANQVALRALAEPGTEVVVESDAHLVAYEAGAHALLGGFQFRTVTAPRGILTRELVAGALRPPAFPYTENSVVAIEDTTNRAGGTVYPLDVIDDLRALTSERGLALYLDGARVLNAVVASGVAADEIGRRVDALSFCISKGLGAPVGSLVVGPRDVVDRARAWRRRYGGAMRQAGILAAAGLYALEHHVDRLAEDHANARALAGRIAVARPEAVAPDEVETNIVYVDTGSVPAADVVAAAREHDVLLDAMGEHLLRLVTHLDVDDAGCARAADIVVAALAD